MEDLDLNDREGHWLDLMYLRLRSHRTLFAKGWGDEKLIKNLIRSNTIHCAPRPINIHFTNQKKEKGLTIYEATFENPFIEIPKPKNSCKAFIEFVIPQGKDLFKKRNDLPLVLIMPASGDDDLNYRKKKLAFPLAQKGIASVLLEIPFYGRRKPEGQISTNVDLVSDYLLMIYLSIQEGRSLLNTFYKNGFPYLGVTGLSMGGFAAGAIASSIPFPTALVCALTGNTTADTLAYGKCFENCVWESLTKSDSLNFARKKMHRYFSLLASLTLLPPPPSLNSALLINAEDDAYIPKINALKLKQYWKGVEQIWMPGGHFTTIFKGPSLMVEGLEQAFKKVPSTRPRTNPFYKEQSFDI